MKNWKSLITLCVFVSSVCYATEPLHEKQPELHTAHTFFEQNAATVEAYTVEYKNKNFIVNPGVFSPKFFPDTLFFADSIKVTSGETFLEIGAGTGLIAVTVALNGAGRVIATDISPAAMQNTLDNACLHHVEKTMLLYEGNVYDALPQELKGHIDTIWWNVPFMHLEKEDLTYLEKALYDPHYKALRKYLSEAKQWLKPGGRLLIGFSDTHGHREVLEEIALENDLVLFVLAERHVNLTGIDETKGAAQFSIQLLEAKGI